jgi:single-strand DNA-binding protein
VNRKRKDNATGTWVEVASFFDVKAFGSQADNVAKYLQKGSQVAVAGTLEQQRWEKDGQKRSKVVIIADNVQFLGSKNGGDPDSVPRSPASPVEDDDPIPF